MRSTRSYLERMKKSWCVERYKVRVDVVQLLCLWKYLDDHFRMGICLF